MASAPKSEEGVLQGKVRFVCGDASESLALLCDGVEASQLQTELEASRLKRKQGHFPKKGDFTPEASEAFTQDSASPNPQDAGLSASALRAVASLGRRPSSERFDVVVFDPPPLAAKRDRRRAALQVLKERLQQVLWVTAAQGLLFLSSCSAAVESRALLSAASG